MSDDDDDVGAGYEAEEVLVSYATNGGWHTFPEVWVGPVRQPGEKSKKWAARYGRAARNHFGIPDGAAIVTAEPEWDRAAGVEGENVDSSNPSLDTPQ
jgi:hypothetical protein